jgi:tRNA A58 N-methylase Trm61
MLILADLKPGDVLYDLGSGDGRAVIMAAQDFGATSVGIELRDDLAKKALISINEAGLNEKAQIIQKDIFNVNLSSANVVFLYLTTSANERIRPKLESELRPGTRVVSHDYEVLGWKPERVNNFCENPKLGIPLTLCMFTRSSLFLVCPI